MDWWKDLLTFEEEQFNHSHIPYMGKFIIRTVFFVNVLFALGLLASYGASSVSPSEIWYLSLFGLAFPLLLFVNILFILFWVLFRKWYFLCSLLVIVFGWSQVKNLFAFDWGEPQQMAQQFKLMSYNVQNFDLYNWTENEESRDKMLNLIREQNPDIIAFQEFYTEDDDEHFQNVRLLVNDLNYKHFHFEKTLTLKEKNHWGLAVFSKYPLSNKNRIAIEGSRGNLIMFCDIELENQRKFRLFNVHLQSIGFGKNDYKFFKKFDIQKPDIESSKSIVRKLREAYIKRGQQADLLTNMVKDSPYPVIVCGDFNDTPVSYTYRKIDELLTDSFAEKGFGLGGTYAGPLPSFRIDYIFTDSVFVVQDFEVIRKEYSDHYPIASVVGY